MSDGPGHRKKQKLHRRALWKQALGGMWGKTLQMADEVNATCFNTQNLAGRWCLVTEVTWWLVI